MQQAPDTVRFDDRLTTVLQIDAGTTSGQRAIWYQLTAMLGQSGHELSEQQAARTLEAIAMLSPAIPVEARIGAAKAMAARCTHAPLAVLLSRDVPAVVTALFDRLHLPESDWALILPELSPLSRSRLRARTDLPQSVHRDLASLASADFALTASPEALHEASRAEDAAAPSPRDSRVGSPIADLVHRIESYRSRKPANDLANLPVAGNDSVAFVTDADGLIRSVVNCPRGMFVGVSLADLAQAEATGVDAGVVAAFGKRDRIAAGRLLITGDSGWSGLWAIQAEPGFDARTGRFTGYRGTLSRDLGEGDSAPPTPGAATADRPLASAMQQMTHELRSPLNAISGFAQLIAGQYFGPVAAGYRDLAARIIDDAGFLTSAFDDVDLASRLDTGRFIASQGDSELGRLLDTVGGGIVRVGTDNQPILLAVAEADARRLLHLLTRPALRPADNAALELTDISEAPDTVTLTFEAAAFDSAARESDNLDAMSLDIARRMAEQIGCSIVTSGRKAIVNLPRVSMRDGQADSAG